MTTLRGPAARAAAREPVTPRQLARLADYMRDAGVTTTDTAWPGTVARILGPNAGTDPAAWSKGQASAFLDALEDFLGVVR